MAYLTAAGIAGGAGLAGALANAPSAPNLPSRGPRAAVFQPLLLAFLQAGGDLGALKVTRKGRKGNKRGPYIGPDGQPIRKADTVKLGGERFLISGAGRDVINQQLQRAQEEQVQQTQANFDLLFGENGPQFLKDRISNRPQQIRDAFGPAVSKGIREAIGGAAPAGTLTTDAILQRVSAPVAFQAETLFQQAEDARNAQELGLSGVPGYGSGFGSNPNNFVQPQGLGYLQGLGMQAFQTGQFAPALANYQGRAASQGYKSGLFSGAGGQLAGIFGNAYTANKLAGSGGGG